MLIPWKERKAAVGPLQTHRSLMRLDPSEAGRFKPLSGAAFGRVPTDFLGGVLWPIVGGAYDARVTVWITLGELTVTEKSQRRGIVRLDRTIERNL